MTQRHEVSKCYWETGAYRLAQHRVVKDFQCVKTTIFTKSNKTRYACIEKVIESLEEKA